MRKQNKRKTLLVAADLQRPAAIDQLKTLGAQINIPVYSEVGSKPPTVCKNGLKEAKKLGCDTVILDTAGRLHIDEEMMAEVREVARVTSPHEVFLVCDAMIGQDAVKSAGEFNEQLELSGVILTKLDGDARGGAALSIKSVTGKPIKFVGTGEKLEGTLEAFRPQGMAERIFGFGDVRGIVEKAQEHVDQEQAARLQEELLQGTFTLQSFLEQLQSVKKMAGGNLKGLLGMLPGIGGQLDDMDIDDDELKHIEGIIRAMTPKERSRPEILNTSRRGRIARGSGRDRMEIDDLLKQFNGMKKVMDQMTRTGGKGPLGKLKALASAKKMMSNPHEMMHQMTAEMGKQLDPSQPRARKGTAHTKKQTNADHKARRKKERQNRRKSRRR
jgi:signal recognition particle subunit SRP54